MLKEFKSMKDYYVYTLIDPRDNQIFYVGKGKGDRINSHFKELDKYLSYVKKGIPAYKAKIKNTDKVWLMKTIREWEKETICKKIIENISEDAAFTLEKVIIERMGRNILKNGPLLNIVPGGKRHYLDFDEPKITTEEEIQEKYPELITVLKEFPNTATLLGEYLEKTNFKKVYYPDGPIGFITQKLNQGDIIIGEKNRDNGEFYALIYINESMNEFFSGVFITHSKENQKKENDLGFQKKELKNNHFLSFNNQKDKQLYIERIELIEKLEWGPYIKIGALNDEGIEYVLKNCT